MENAIYKFRKLKSTDTFLMVQIINKIGVAELKGLLDKDSILTIIENIGSNNNDENTEDAESTENPENGENTENEKSLDVLTQIGISLAFDLATIVFKNLPKCEEDIYSILANVSETDVDFIRNLDIDVFFDMIVNFFKKEEFKDFITVVSKFLK